ncbi:MAG: GNAT family N-acetyltransferase [Flavobacteriales bacterium]|nr:GNAT family N-acetyltransferase [Flavobacteriales bacterium]
MRLQRYGIQLESLRPDHLEMVRLWRNQDYVRNNMQFQGLLTREDQEQWFTKLDSERNLYWVIRTHKYPIGLIHIKDIDISLAEGEAGIFVGEPSYLEMPQPMLAILFMMEMAFYALGLKRLKAKIRSGNSFAISFNLKLGYKLQPDQPSDFQYYTVNENDFEQATEHLRAQSAKMFGSGTVVQNVADLNSLQSDLLKGLLEQSRYFSPKLD